MITQQHTYFYFLSFFLTSFSFGEICTLWEIPARTSPESSDPRAFKGKREQGAALETGLQNRARVPRGARSPGRAADPPPPHPAAPAIARLALLRHPARAGNLLAPGHPTPLEGGRPPLCPPVPCRGAGPDGCRAEDKAARETGGAATRGGAASAALASNTDKLARREPCRLRCGEQRRFPATLTPLRLQGGTCRQCPRSWG